MKTGTSRPPRFLRNKGPDYLRAAAALAGRPSQRNAFLRRRQAGFHNPFVEPPLHSENVLDEKTDIDTGSAGIDAPSTIRGDAPRPDALPLRARLIAIAKGRIAAAEIGVALPQRGLKQPIRDGDRVRDKQGVPQGLAFAKKAHRFAAAQMQMDIHRPDLAAEKRRRFRSSKHGLGAPMVGQAAGPWGARRRETEDARGSGQRGRAPTQAQKKSRNLKMRIADTILPWLTHDAMIHLTVPHGL